jgi:S-adenosyl-L-methionine hydrolase (adenosine-forming)
MIITLTTDFGLRDSFVGAMKGVIFGIAPAVHIVDITHGIAAGDIRGGAFALLTAAPFFPAETIHVAVIDPGVGSPRKAIAIRTPRATFLGPDNGVLSWAVREEDQLEIRSVENPELFLPHLSSTFHGRDLFAPAAAWLAGKRELRDLGPELADFQRTDWPNPVRVQEGWKTEVIHVDVYGNAITALPAERARAANFVLLPRGARIPFGQFYAVVPRGSPVALIGSSGFVEIAINQGDAANELSLSAGSEVIVA